MVEEEGKFVPPFDPLDKTQGRPEEFEGRQAQGREEESKEEEPTIEGLIEACRKLFVDPETGENISIASINPDTGEETTMDYDEFKKFMEEEYLSSDDPNVIGRAIDYIQSMIITSDTLADLGPDQFLMEAGIMESPEAEQPEPEDIVNLFEKFFVDKNGNQIAVNDQSFEDFRDHALNMGDLNQIKKYLFSWLADIGENPDQFFYDNNITLYY